MKKYYIKYVYAFVLNYDDDDEIAVLSSMSEEYAKETGHELDTWFIHSYNAVRMVGDTAIKNKTCDSSSIARLLHENGYEGLGQRFYFDENGLQARVVYEYGILDENGYAETYIFVE